MGRNSRNRRRELRERKRSIDICGAGSPQMRFAPLWGHYPSSAICLVAGVSERFFEGLPVSSEPPQKFRWQPEELQLVRQWPDSVLRRLLPWRTPQAIRSCRRDYARKHTRDAVQVLTEIVKKRLHRAMVR